MMYDKRTVTLENGSFKVEVEVVVLDGVLSLQVLNTSDHTTVAFMGLRADGHLSLTGPDTSEFIGEVTPEGIVDTSIRDRRALARVYLDSNRSSDDKKALEILQGAVDKYGEHEDLVQALEFCKLIQDVPM